MKPLSLSWPTAILLTCGPAVSGEVNLTSPRHHLVQKVVTEKLFASVNLALVKKLE